MNKKKFLFLLFAGVALCVLQGCGKGGSKRLDVKTSALLEKVIEINELQTVEYTYNSYAIAYDESGDKKVEKYAVAYKGTVTLGINEGLKISQNNEKVEIHIPKVKLLNINVDIPNDDKGSVIARNKKYTSKTDWLNEAQKLAKADLTDKVLSDSSLWEVSKENTRNAVEALLKPIEKAADCTFVFVEE